MSKSIKTKPITKRKLKTVKKANMTTKSKSKTETKPKVAAIAKPGDVRKAEYEKRQQEAGLLRRDYRATQEHHLKLRAYHEKLKKKKS